MQVIKRTNEEVKLFAKCQTRTETQLTAPSGILNRILEYRGGALRIKGQEGTFWNPPCQLFLMLAGLPAESDEERDLAL